MRGHHSREPTSGESDTEGNAARNAHCCHKAADEERAQRTRDIDHLVKVKRLESQEERPSGVLTGSLIDLIVGELSSPDPNDQLDNCILGNPTRGNTIIPAMWTIAIVGHFRFMMIYTYSDPWQLSGYVIKICC